MSEFICEKKEYEVIVSGGGLSGLCAALASARSGVKTALIQNRPVLGGNASPEIKMHICGADIHGNRLEARETGIIEELLLSNAVVNPQGSFEVFSAVLWSKANFQENLDLYLNTHIYAVSTSSGLIKSIKAIQLSTEKAFDISAKIFIDATGDGTIGYLAGAEYMYGRESKEIFNESCAHEHSDNIVMGNTIYFTTKDLGYPVPFKKPSWAYTYEEKDLAFRDHSQIDAGYWWVEIGGDATNTIRDGEYIRDELIKSVYGIWDHIKNGGNHGADNLVLDWVGSVPGKRESRRLTGDYVLNGDDLLSSKIFPDAVAYGGWPMDMHAVGGLNNQSSEATRMFFLDDVYTIPYRSLYSKNVNNLMLAGRNISVSHMAFGSTRDMATTSVVGQASGTAAALAVKKNILPRELNNHIKELQQSLIKEDAYIPGYKNEDETDIAKNAFVTCSSAKPENPCANVINGISRNIAKDPLGGKFKAHDNGKREGVEIIQNGWVSNSKCAEGEWLSLSFNKKITPGEIRLKFDSNLSVELTPSAEKRVNHGNLLKVPSTLVKNYIIEFYLNGKQVYSQEVRDNHLRLNSIKLPKKISCDLITVKINDTYGDSSARIFEVRVYE